MMFLLQCPQCKNTMKYMTSDQLIAKKRKRCVYCGHSYLVHDRIVKRLG